MDKVQKDQKNLKAQMVNNEFYQDHTVNWYEAEDHPIALLRREGLAKTQWVKDRLQEMQGQNSPPLSVLDIGCGAGMLTNELASDGFTVTGIDLSAAALAMAKDRDLTQTVTYLCGDAQEIPLAGQSFDVITCMDFLEHVEDPEAVIAEISRLLKPGGVCFFHTFNRNWLSYLVIIKGVEWFVKNTPPHMHLYRYFIKPRELSHMLRTYDLHPESWIGLRPKINWAFFKMLATGRVTDKFHFQFTQSLLLSYLGLAIKDAPERGKC